MNGHKILITDDEVARDDAERRAREIAPERRELFEALRQEMGAEEWIALVELITTVAEKSGKAGEQRGMRRAAEIARTAALSKHEFQTLSLREALAQAIERAAKEDGDGN